MTRIGVLGGTFDPVHLGHLVAASEVHHQLGLQQILFVPAGEPWQKASRAVTDPEDRYAMCLLATADDPRFDVSRVDLDRSGPTYTVDTLQDLRRQWPEGEFHVIVGADALLALPTWHRHEEVLSNARVVVVTRPGHDLDGWEGPQVTRVEIPAVGVSSTECRLRVLQDRPLDYLVHPAVAGYIRKRRLYR